MKTILHLAFLTCFVSSGCNKTVKAVSQQDKTTDNKSSTETASPTKTNANQQLTLHTIKNDPVTEQEPSAPENINIRLAQLNLSNAKIVSRQSKVAKRLNREEINKINNSIDSKPILFADPNIKIITSDEAFNRINVSLSMASPPEVFAEDASYYYFSGGVSVGRIDDFSSGIRISKDGGVIHIWPRRE